MKEPISVSNLTLDLYLDYVRPAAIAAGIIELTVTEDGKQIYVTDTATADEIAHCMYCACMCAGNDGIERTHEEYVRHEAERMIGQLEVSIKYDLHNTVATLTVLLDAMTAALQPAEAPQSAEEQQPATATEAATVAGIIRRQGGYRERDLLSRPHDMTHGETWNAAHKVVYVTETTPGPDGYRPGCAVDIVTRSIVG